MVEAVTFQTVFQFLQTVSIMVGIAYYFIVMNNQQKNQKLTATYDIFEVVRSEEHYRTWLELLWLEWDDVDDFYAKYNDLEWQSKWGTMFQKYDSLGLLWKNGLIKLEDVSNIMGAGCLLLWVRYKPVVEMWRSRSYSDQWMHWEQLCEAVKPLVEDKWGPYVLERYYHITPPNR